MFLCKEALDLVHGVAAHEEAAIDAPVADPRFVLKCS
jgi:hypothetical protein